MVGPRGFCGTASNDESPHAMNLRRIRIPQCPLMILLFAGWASVCLGASEAGCAERNGAGEASPEVSLFDIGSVRLEGGRFSEAVRSNREYLLALDPDRLLAPFLSEAGLEQRAVGYGNWESGGLGGHTAGHYLSALSFMIASGADTADGELNRRLDYMLDELERCQDALGTGYIGGVPNGRELWEEVAAGKIEAHGFGLNNRWVPLYNIHKTYAGLRDAWVEGKREKALKLLEGMGDWLVDLLSGLSDDQVQTILQSEHGGMNEVMADLFILTRNERYLDAAIRLCHKAVLDPLMRGEDRLTGMHANTQIPKVVGMARIAEAGGDPALMDGARFFWDTVVGKRSVAFGGNSVREHFNDPSDFREVVTDRQGPETCNTYNMLRLTESLFMASPDACYADYYERALYNHILSAIHPTTPGYVYFTPLRPAHYRVYSQPDQCFWCCVGTGMENPGKYGRFIYAKGVDGNLYVNLFIPSVLKVREGMVLHQLTRFPDEASSRLKLELDEPVEMALRIRHPSWVRQGEFKVRVNGEWMQGLASRPSSYVEIKRVWQDGDTVDLELPMHPWIERLPDESDWVALKYGPLLLASPVGDHHLDGLRADDSRMGHVAGGPLVPLNETRVLVRDERKLEDLLAREDSPEGLTFRLKGGFYPDDPKGLLLKPFSWLHDQRYQMYWEWLEPSAIETRQAELAEVERRNAAREAATLDYVAVGEQQSEVEHGFSGTDSSTGIDAGMRWREGAAFSYTLNAGNAGAAMLEILVREGDGEVFANGVLLDTWTLDAALEDGFQRKVHPLTESVLRAGEDGLVTVRFSGKDGVSSRVFGVRLLRSKPDVHATNPIMWADVPDMAMIRVGDTYYMSSTTMHMHPGLPIMKSKDLVSWEMLGYAYDTLVDNAKMRLEDGADAYGAGSWASSLRYHDGVYYVSTFSSTSGKTHVYSTRDIEGGAWETFDFEPSLHDHTLWFEDDGRVFMIYGGGDLRLVELNPGGRGIKAGTEETVIIRDAGRIAGGEPGLPAEGSQLFRHDGKYYLFNITWPKNDMRTVLVHRADKLTGPWEGRVAFKDRGIAQGGLIDTPDDKWYAYLFQDCGAVGRIPYLVPVEWVDGWPVIGVDGKAPESLPIKAPEDRHAGIVGSDEFDRALGSADLPLVWQWNHLPNPDAWSLTERPGFLRLHAFRRDAHVLETRNMLTQRTFGPVCSVETAVETDGLNVGDRAGLIALQKRYGWVGVEKGANGLSLVVEQIGEEVDAAVSRSSVPLEPDAKDVYLKVSCDFRDRIDQARFFYSLDGKQWHSLGDVLQMSYTLPHFMGYRIGLFVQATGEPGGFADFDYYRISGSR